MGDWGTGNFENDISCDYLAGVVGYFEQVIERVLAGGLPGDITQIEFSQDLSDVGDGCLIPTVAIITALHEALDSDYLPSIETVERWKREYLRLFDLPNASYDWPEMKEKRRRAIQETFDKLLSQCRSHAEKLNKL